MLIQEEVTLELANMQTSKGGWMDVEWIKPRAPKDANIKRGWTDIKRVCWEPTIISMVKFAPPNPRCPKQPCQ